MNLPTFKETGEAEVAQNLELMKKTSQHQEREALKKEKTSVPDQEAAKGEMRGIQETTKELPTSTAKTGMMKNTLQKPDINTEETSSRKNTPIEECHLAQTDQETMRVECTTNTTIEPLIITGGKVIVGSITTMNSIRTGTTHTIGRTLWI